MIRPILILLIALVGVAPATAAELTGTLKKINESGIFVIGHRQASPPFSFVDKATGKPAGYSVDLCLRVAAGVKQALDLTDLKIEYVTVTPENRIDMVKSGKIDIECGSTTNNFARQQEVDFSNLTFITGSGMLIKTGTRIEGVTDLEGKKLAVARGTTTEKSMTSFVKDKFLNAELVKVADHDEGLAALEDGSVDAYISDWIVLVGLAQRSSARDKLMISDEFLTYEPYGLMLRRNDADFRRVVNRTLANVYRTGAVVDIYAKWFGPMGLEPSALLKAMYVLNSIPE